MLDREEKDPFQAKMKRLFVLEKFAFVDKDGLIYTSLGPQTDIDQYQFDYLTLSGPEISIKNLQSEDKNVIIAVPVRMYFQGKELLVCFMEIDMREMLSGVSMDAQEDGATFCNMYTSDGIALSKEMKKRLLTYVEIAGKPVLQHPDDVNYVDMYDEFYDELLASKANETY